MINLKVTLNVPGPPTITIEIPMVARHPIIIVVDKARQRMIVDGLADPRGVPSYAIRDVARALSLAADIADGNVNVSMGVVGIEVSSGEPKANVTIVKSPSQRLPPLDIVDDSESQLEHDT